jgi:hypothetical protein
MTAGSYFTQSQNEAWGYVEYGVNNGYTQSSALAEYRGAGGQIRTQYWNDLWHSLTDAKNDWDTVSYYKATDTLPEYLYLQTPTRFKDKYTVRASATIKDADGNVIDQAYRQISSNVKLTKGEAEQRLRDEFRVGMPGRSPKGDVVEFGALEFYKTG